MPVDGGKFDLRLLRDLLDGFGADAADLPGDHARVRVGSKRLDNANPLFRRKSFSFFRIFRCKPYIRLFGDLTDRSRTHVAYFSGDPACVRVGLQRLDDARPRLGRKSFPFPYRHRRKLDASFFGYRAHGRRIDAADFPCDGARVRIYLQRLRDLLTRFRGKFCPAALAGADSELAGNDAYGCTIDAADLSGDRRPVRIALQRLEDLRAFRLGNHGAIRAQGDCDDKAGGLYCTARKSG
ncbi:MAG: hypothetical protein WAL59_16720 [Roseiarcus sp.]